MEDDRPMETLTVDVVRLCALLARILCRGVMERDPHLLALFSSSPSSEEKKGTTDGSAA